MTDKPKCEEVVPGTLMTADGRLHSTCSRNASADPDSFGIPTKCGQHSEAGKTTRKQKRENRYAKERAGDDARWAASDARRDLAVAVRAFLDKNCDQVTVLDFVTKAKFQALVEIIEKDPTIGK